MASRQHSGTKLPQDGENPLGDGNTSLRGRDRYAVWFMRGLQADTIQAAGRIAVTIGNGVIAPLLCEEFTLFHAEVATTSMRVEHQQMIVEPTCCARENVRKR